MPVRDIRKVDVAVIGAGHAGLSALKEISKCTDDFVLIDSGPSPMGCEGDGGTRSKALIEMANVHHLRRELGRLDIDVGRQPAPPRPDASEDLRDLHDLFADLMLEGYTGGLEGKLIEGCARLIGPNHIHVDGRIVEARAIVVATGSRSVVPAPWRFVDGIVTSEDLLESGRLPESLAVVGLGPAGLELGQALQRLGVRVCGFDESETLAGIADADIAREVLAIFDREFPIALGRGVDIQRYGKRFRVTAGNENAIVDKLLIVTGRCLDSTDLGWNKLGMSTDERGLPLFDPKTLRIPGTSIFVAGTRRQSAAAQGRTAGYNAVHRAQRPLPETVPMSIVFTDPGIATVGAPVEGHDEGNLVAAKLGFGAPGPAMAIRRAHGVLKLYADVRSRRLLGGAMVGPGCEHLAHLLAGYVQQGMTVDRALQMPFHHSVIEEVLQDGLAELQRALGDRGAARAAKPQADGRSARSIELVRK